MKIFDLIRELHTAINSHEKDHSNEYQAGYRDCLSDMEERIKDSVEVGLK